MTPFFNRVMTFVQDLTLEMIFSNDERLIVLKSRNLEICEHSSYLIINQNLALKKFLTKIA